MKIKLELFGASRDFSNKDHLELNDSDSPFYIVCENLVDIISRILRIFKNLKIFYLNFSFLDIKHFSFDKPSANIIGLA